MEIPLVKCKLSAKLKKDKGGEVLIEGNRSTIITADNFKVNKTGENVVRFNRFGSPTMDQRCIQH